MSHRTPRLIFRDNDFLPPVGGGATSFFQQSNQLPDFEDDIRGKISAFFFSFSLFGIILNLIFITATYSLYFSFVD